MPCPSRVDQVPVDASRRPPDRPVSGPRDAQKPPVPGSITIRENYRYGGNECRWGDAEIYMPDGTYRLDEVRMCRDAYGEWQVARYQ